MTKSAGLDFSSILLTRFILLLLLLLLLLSLCIDAVVASKSRSKSRSKVRFGKSCEFGGESPLSLSGWSAQNSK